MEDRQSGERDLLDLLDVERDGGHGIVGHEPELDVALLGERAAMLVAPHGFRLAEESQSDNAYMAQAMLRIAHRLHHLIGAFDELFDL